MKENIYREAGIKSQGINAGQSRRKKKSVNYKKILLSAALIATISIGVNHEISKVVDLIDENLTNKEISEMYTSGFVEGSVNRTANNQGYWYDYNVISNAIITSNEPVYSFYNTVNDILSASLSDSDKKRNLDDLLSSLHSKLNNDVKTIQSSSEDFILIIPDNWGDFLSLNHFDDPKTDSVTDEDEFQKAVQNNFNAEKEVVR